MNTFAVAALWLGLAVISTIIANFLSISVALVEICVGFLAASFLADWIGLPALGADLDWIKFVAGTGSVLLTFLAGAEIDPISLRVKWREVLIVGAMGFLAPFVGCALAARYLLNWGTESSLLAGIALSTTSMAVVYAVMLEYGFNRTEFGKGVLGACFVNDLGTVIVLGLIFAPADYRTFIFLGVSTVLFIFLPWLTMVLTKHYGNRTAAIRTKWILFVLFFLGALALWSGSEAVLPAYIAGIILSGALGRDELFARRLRTLTIGFLTPFFFIRAGTLVSMNALLTMPLIILVLFLAKVATKILGLYPVISIFRDESNEKWYYTLLMSTGLTFGTISALYGLSHGIITREQYSCIVVAVIGSAVIPTLIANYYFLPAHLFKRPSADEEMPELNGNGNHTFVERRKGERRVLPDRRKASKLNK